MWGIKKKRSKIGTFIDRHGYSQENFRSVSGISRNTISRLCNDPKYIPTGKIIKKAMKALKKIDPNAKIEDFFDM